MDKAVGPHSSTLAWKIPWMEEPGRLQSMGSLRVGHNWATSLSLFTFMHWRNGNPVQCSCLENPREGGAWWAAIYGVAHSRTRLKWLSSRSIVSHVGFPGGASGKEPAYLPMQETTETGLILELGRFLGRGHGNPLQYYCLENPMDRGSWRATVHKVTKRWTRLKQLRTHTCRCHVLD